MRIDIVLISYNQEQYIAQAVESILMQRVNDDVKVRVIVADDCSTDKTLEIIKSYEENSPFPFTYLEGTTNLGMVNNYRRVLHSITADYFCILEGDDYWIDQYKLQKQLIFMNNHQNCGLCYADCSILNGTTLNYKAGLYHSLQRTIDTKNPLLETHYQSNVTWMIRGDMLEYFEIPDDCTDVPLIFMYECCLHSSVCFLPEVLGVFRVHIGSVSNQLENTYKKYWYHRNVFLLVQKYICRFPNSVEVGKKIYTDAAFNLFLKSKKYSDNYLLEVLKTNMQCIDWDEFEKYMKKAEKKEIEIQYICNSRAYRLGKFLLKPVSYIRQCFKKVKIK